MLRKFFHKIHNTLISVGRILLNVPEKGGLFQLKDTDFFVRVLSAGLTYTTYTPVTQYGTDNQTSSQLRTQMFNYLYEQKDKYFDWNSIVSQRSNIPEVPEQASIWGDGVFLQSSRNYASVNVRAAGNTTTVGNYYYNLHVNPADLAQQWQVTPAQPLEALANFATPAAEEEEEEEVDGLHEYYEEYVDDELAELDEPPYDLED